MKIHHFNPIEISADRSSSICHYQSKIALNRTRSNYQCHDALNKPLLSSMSNHQCDHCYPPRVSSPPASTQHISSSNGQYLHSVRRHQLSGTASSNSSLIDDEHQNIRRISNGDELECTTKLTCAVNSNDGFRRRKSASLNSPASSGKEAEGIYSYPIHASSSQIIVQQPKNWKS